ncbi:MAG TPA: hypothetical protein VHA33_04840 [Candidatus Angelobacter sp.]|jgi:hypothetical protein|nr:hypothetical protein [Candidatus Angelobacter sp.]
MKLNLIVISREAATKLMVMSFALFFYILKPSVAIAQGSCVMQQHVVDSWAAKVQADQDAISKQPQGSRGLKLDDSESSNERLQSDTKRLEQAKSRLAACQKKANTGASPAPAKPQPVAGSAHPVSLSKSADAKWDIDGLGILTLGQLDPGSQTVAGILLVQTDSLPGIPRNTKLTMKGPFDTAGFKIQGSTLTKGDYLNPTKRKEVFAYEYRLTLEAQLEDPRTPGQLSGTATLVRSERYRGQKEGTRLGRFAVTGPYTPGELACAMPVAEAEVFDPSNPETSQKYLDRYHQALAQTSGKTVLSDADVVSNAKALLPFLRYAAAHQQNSAPTAPTQQSAAQRRLALEPEQNTKPAQQNNPALAYVTGLLGPSALGALRTQLQNTATVARAGGIVAETAGATETGATMAEGLAGGGAVLEGGPGTQLVGAALLMIAAGVYIWEKTHSKPIVNPAAQTCTAVKLEPPGDCTKERHRYLQDQINNACKTVPMSCDKSFSFPDDCGIVLENIRRFQKCIEARQLINNECFRGGDPTHNEEILGRSKGLARCITKYAENCK